MSPASRCREGSAACTRNRCSIHRGRPSQQAEDEHQSGSSFRSASRNRCRAAHIAVFSGCCIGLIQKSEAFANPGAPGRRCLPKGAQCLHSRQLRAPSPYVGMSTIPRPPPSSLEIETVKFPSSSRTADFVNPPRSTAAHPPIVDSRQLTDEELLARWPAADFDVPRAMPAAVVKFWRHPTPQLIAAGMSAVAAVRWTGGTFGLVDLAAALLTAAGWMLQEWAMHRYLLHKLEGWMGHSIHQEHHDLPFYHVSIDEPPLVLGWTAVAAAIFHLVLPHTLAWTVLLTYMGMGLLYEWTHYIVHTRVVPATKLGKEIKKHHTLHHLVDKECWLAFTMPAVDTWMGTVPPPKCRPSRAARSSPK